MIRPTRDYHHLSIALTVGEYSTCYRNLVGAIIVRDGQVVSTGYAGAPRGTKDCLEHGECLRDKLSIPHGQRYEICRSVHAEQNAIINAARAGVSVYGGDIYCSLAYTKSGKVGNAFPCFMCKRMIINAGLTRCICSMESGIEVFNVLDWVISWRTHDLTDDGCRYGNGRPVGE